MWWRGTKSVIESFALGVQQLSLDMLSVLSNTARIAVDVDGGEGCLGVLWEIAVTFHEYSEVVKEFSILAKCTCMIYI